MGVGGQRQAPVVLLPGMTQYSLCRRLGRPQGWSGRVQKISPPPGFDPSTVQLVARAVSSAFITTHATLSQSTTCLFQRKCSVFYTKTCC